jgi:hypothetical protein
MVLVYNSTVLAEPVKTRRSIMQNVSFSVSQGVSTTNTIQVVGNGHLQTDLDEKNKKALYLK